MTKTQAAAIAALRVKLDPRNPANKATDEVKAHLLALGPWLDSWVLPLVDALEPKAPRWVQEYARAAGYRASCDAEEVRRDTEEAQLQAESEKPFTPATAEDVLIWRRVAPVAVQARYLKADRTDARITSDHVKLASRGHDLHRAYKRWVDERGRA